MKDSESISIAKQIKRYAQVGGIVGKLATKLASQKYLGVKLDKNKHAAEIRAALGSIKGPLMKVAQILATNAYKISSVSILSPIDYSSILWAITFGIIFFSDYPDIYVLIGSLIIVISTYYIIYRENKLGKKINLNKISIRQV